MNYKKESKAIVFDIETIPVEASKTRIEKLLREYEPPELKIPSNYKDPAKIAAYEAEFPQRLAQHKQEWLASKMAKDHFRLDGCRPISVSLGICEDNEVKNILGCASDDSCEVAQFFTDYVNQAANGAPFKLVGFNINGFDLPIIFRWMVHANAFLKRRLGKWDAVDLCAYPLKGHGGLKEICSALGMELLDEEGQDADGSFVSKWYEEQNWERILEYNKHDVLVEGSLYNNIRRIWDV